MFNKQKKEVNYELLTFTLDEASKRHSSMYQKLLLNLDLALNHQPTECDASPGFAHLVFIAEVTVMKSREKAYCKGVLVSHEKAVADLIANLQGRRHIMLGDAFCNSLTVDDVVDRVTMSQL